MRKAASRTGIHEKAADLRDAITALKQTTAKTTRFERTPERAVAAMPGTLINLELRQGAGLPAPPVRIEGFSTFRTSAAR